MSLPSAPPAFDASDDTGADGRADITAAVGLFLVEGAVLVVVFGAWLLSGVSFFPAGGAEVDADPRAVGAAGLEVRAQAAVGQGACAGALRARRAAHDGDTHPPVVSADDLR